ncbi:hypothetical protein B0A55_11882 [Friedmanniomyces simplex]|uniref:Uncharacterized protein n=1 Tax=Friedmanniomyces simplex TaxID=329884 RepID=A0A4U0WH83_9PEZI|nr:hypothetical protein B0A55_11882 [Friedmanniomyces simplex]
MAATWLPVSSDRHELQQRRGQLEAVEDLMRAVKASQTAFRDLLSSHQHLEKLDVSVMQEIVAFLQSSKDEPQAQNGLTLTTWLAQRDIEQEALHAMALCIRDKARLRTLDEDQLRHVLASLLGRIDGEAPSIEQAFAEALDALPASQRHGAVTELSRHFRTSFKLGKHNTDTIRTLFRILDSFQSLQGSHVQHSTWHQVYRRLGSLLRPAALAEHLCSLDRTDLAQVLLRYWVPRYLEQLNDGTAAELHDHGKFRRITIASRMRSRAEVHGIVHEYAQLWTSTPIAVGHGLDDGSKKHTDPLIDLLVMLAKWRKSYAIFLQDLLDMLSAVQTRGQVWTTFESVRRHPELGVPNSVAKTLVHYLAATSDPAHLHLAWEVFEAVPSLSVLECIDFTLQLIEHGLGTPDRIFHLLNKKTGPDIVKPEFRGKPQLALQSAHIDLAHLAAYAWAKQENTPSRVAFRRVWEVYRFLQDRGAPLSALMSRSLVRAGVVRPIQEGKNVSLAQMKYILALVQRLEGDDVAADLDRLVETEAVDEEEGCVVRC